MRRILLLAGVVLAIISFTDACGGGSGGGGSSGDDSGSSSGSGNNGKGSSGSGKDPNNRVGDGDVDPDAGPTEGPIEKFLGPDVTPSGMPDGRQDDTDGNPDLSCDFEGPCCWSNANKPEDNLDYLQFSGAVDENKPIFKNVPPEGKFAGTGSDTADGEARFVSCPIKCSKEDSIVTLMHWRSDPAIQMQVCTQPAGGGSLENCQELLADESPGPSLVTLPPGEDFQIVIVTKDFPSDSGMALIDSIVVDYVPCGTGPGAACDAECDGTSTCNYEAGSPSESNSEGWASQTGRYKNPVTGIRAPESDVPYLGTYIYRVDESTLSHTFAEPLGDETTFNLEFWENTEDMEMSSCCDDECNFLTDGPADAGKQAWQRGTVVCPAGTKKLEFKCAGSGINQGACGIHDIKVVDAKTGEPICAAS